MGIWLKTDNAGENWPVISRLFKSEMFMENDLSESAQIYISEKDTDELENCTLVFLE